MAKYTPSDLSPDFFSQFSNNSSDMFAWKMDAVLESAYGSKLEDIPHGDFDAVVLSGFRTEQSTGAGTDAYDARIIEIPVTGEKYLEVKVRPLEVGTGQMLPSPLDPELTPDQRERLISMHEWARSDFPIEDLDYAINCGVKLTCYYKYGSIRNSSFAGLRFKAPTAAQLATSAALLEMDVSNGTALEDLFGGSLATLGSLFPGGANLAEDNVMKKFANELPAAGETTSIYGSTNASITKTVQEQLDFWNGKKEKSSGPEYDRLKVYWDSINKSDWTATGTPWSAAFVSYCLQQLNTGFKGAASHYKYTENVIGGRSSGWKAFSLTKGDAIINIGDVLVRPRGSGTRDKEEYWYSHGDVVYKIQNNVAYLAGGNLGDTAKIAARISLDSSSKASDTKDYIVILKKVS